MSIDAMARLLSDKVRACLLLAYFLASYFGNCDSVLTEHVQKISTDEGTTRPETTIPQGTLRGINMVTHHNRSVFGFIGIPYAQPPVGDLRFKAPVSADAWNGTLDAAKDSEVCPHSNNQGEFVGDEDCLYLNIFTPQLPTSNSSTTLLPVMVFIIGGQFKEDDNSIKRFGPEFLLDEDVVLVIPHFRVGVLGCLSTGDEVSPGNYGLKDIVEALKWNQNNIRYFGGDPNLVTLLGTSAGATSVHFLALSNLTNGLFHKCITQSGTALLSYVNEPKEVHAKRAIQLGEYLGCPTNSSTLLVDCLRGLNASQLIDTRSVFYIWKSYPGIIWIPTTEVDIEGALLTDIPANLYTTGRIRDLPWLVSSVRDEGLCYSIAFYKDPDLFEDFLDNIDLALPLILGYENTVDNVQAHTDALKSYYLKDLTADRSLLLANLTQLIGDFLFMYPTYYTIQHQLTFASNPLYFASFEYRGTFSHTYSYSGGSTHYTGVAHGDEMIYLFKDQQSSFGPPDYEYSETDLVMVDTMVKLWTSFVINGTPTVVNSDNTTIWEPYSSLKNYLQIGNGSDTALVMKNDLLLERMQFWDQLTKSTPASSTNFETLYDYTANYISSFLSFVYLFN